MGKIDIQYIQLPLEIIQDIVVNYDLSLVDIFNLYQAYGPHAGHSNRWLEVLQNPTTYRNTTLSLTEDGFYLPTNVWNNNLFLRLIYSIGHLRIYALPSKSVDIHYSKFLNLSSLNVSRVNLINNDLLVILRSNLCNLRNLNLSGCLKLNCIDNTLDAKHFCLSSSSLTNIHNKNIIRLYKPVLRRPFMNLDNFNLINTTSNNNNDNEENMNHIMANMIISNANRRLSEEIQEHLQDNQIDYDEMMEHEIPLLLSIYNALPSLEILDISFTKVLGPNLSALKNVLKNKYVFQNLKSLNISYFAGHYNKDDWNVLFDIINNKTNLKNSLFKLDYLALNGNFVEAENLLNHSPKVNELDLRDCNHLTKDECMLGSINGAKVIHNSYLTNYSESSIRNFIELIT